MLEHMKTKWVKEHFYGRTYKRLDKPILNLVSMIHFFWKFADFLWFAELITCPCSMDYLWSQCYIVFYINLNHHCTEAARPSMIALHRWSRQTLCCHRVGCWKNAMKSRVENDRSIHFRYFSAFPCETQCFLYTQTCRNTN